MGSKTLFSFAGMLVASGFLSAAGDTCTWTGAENGFWTNANNWAELRVPGQYETSAGRQGTTGDVAVFGDGLAGRKATTVDLDGVYSVREVLTTGTNRYVYGTSEEQMLPIEPFGTFSVAETAETPAATLAARLKLGVDCISTNWGGETMTVRSNSRETFVLGKWGYGVNSPDRPAGAEGGQARVNFDGSGDVRMTEPYQADAWNMMVYLRMTGKLIVDAPLKVRMLSADSGLSGETMEVELTENGSIEPDSCYNYFGGRRSMHVSGPGTFYFGVGERGGVGVVCDFQHHGTLSLDCPSATSIIGAAPPDDFLTRILVSWGGSIEMRGGSTMKGVAQMMEGALIAERVGMRGTYGSFGDMDFVLGNGGTVRYVGGGETTDRSIALTNRSDKATSGDGCLDQQGAGAWTVQSAVALSPGMERGTLTLRGAQIAPATFTGTIAPNISVSKSGAGDWTFAPASDFTDAMYVSGGTLHLGGSMHLASLYATGGSTRVVVPEGATLEIDALTVSSDRKVDFCALGESSAVKIAGVESGDAPAGVTYNGHRAVVDAEGRLALAEGGDAIWKAAESGDWTDAARWTWGLTPAVAGSAFVDAIGGDYAVSVAEDATVSNLVVRNIGDGTATLRVSDGATLEVAARTTTSPFLTIGTGGRIEVVDATLRLSDKGNAVGGISNNSGLSMEEGAEIAVSGTGVLETFGIPRSGYTAGELTDNLNTQFKFESGTTTTFTDDARLTLKQEDGKTVFYHTLKAAPGRTTRMSFKDRAHPDFSATPWTLYVTGGGGRAVLEFDSEYDGTVKNLWNQTFVGNHEGGVGEILYRRGTYETGGWDMYHIASPNTDTTSGSTIFATGRVEIASTASLTAYAGMRISDYAGFGGFTVGNGIALQRKRGQSHLRGEFTVAGSFTQHMGSFLVGVGPCAEGDVLVDGGNARVVANASRTNALMFGEVVVGAFGGRARLALDGGEFTTLRNVYVGGVLTNDLCHWHRNGAFITQWHDADGTLSVKDGAFTTAGSIVLGRDGTGALELSGTGVVSAAGIVVSNTVGQAASKIRFTAGADGRCGQIAPGTSLSFWPGAAVAVDVSDCAATRSRVVVWNLDEPPAGLDDVDLELVGNEAVRGQNALSFEDGGRRLVWNAYRGTVILLR